MGNSKLIPPFPVADTLLVFLSITVASLLVFKATTDREESDGIRAN